jgi:site-specific DNA-methyltransferase (adenine-specific)
MRDERERETRMQTSVLYQGDNLHVLRETVPDGKVDLVYLDPPFATNRLHSFTFRDSQGDEIEARAVAFSDKWEWNAQAKAAYKRLTSRYGEELHAALAGLRTALTSNSMMAYLVSVTERLCEIHRSLCQTGSLYLHCDRRTAHFFRIICDSLFGESNFRNEIIWHYTGGGRAKRYFSRKHDVILFYTKSDNYTFNLDAIREPYKKSSGYARSGIISATGKKYFPHPDGTPVDDVWGIPMLNPMSKERTGYPTQKPLALMERIIAASSNESGTVLDPYCGSGTTLIAAQKLGRSWIGIDSSELAVTNARHRFEQEFPDVDFEVIGQTLDLKRAIELLKETEIEKDEVDSQALGPSVSEMFEGG